ncbi:MAG: ADOP family duplicated permease [Gemmatimonadaceae bacterium]
MLMNRIGKDVRLALRALRRSPTFTTTAILILGLGIGMAVAMVTVFQAVLLRQLPVQDQDRIVVMWTYRDPAVEFGTLRRDVDEVRRVSRTMSDVGAIAHWGTTPGPLVDGDRSIVLNRTVVSGNVFDVLGSRAHLGRLLRPEDELSGAKPVVVLSYKSWQREFAADPAIVGRNLLEPYSQSRYEVIGVAPPGLDYPVGVGFFLSWTNAGNMGVTAIARLAPNATPEMARSEFLSVVQRQGPERALTGAHVFPFPRAMLGDVRPVLLIMTAAVALLLLIACVNVGNLLLLRAASRTRELSVRRALGATYGDIVRQLLVESGCLALAGGALGMLLAQALLRTLVLLAPANLPRAAAIQLAGLPFVAAIVVTSTAVLVFGVVPALVAARGNVALPLRLDVRSGSGTRGRRRVRQLLVASQVALALILLAGAGLLARSLAQLQRIDLGFTTEHLSILAFSWPAPRYDSIPTKLYPVGEQLMPRLRAIPGVLSVTPVVAQPFVGANVFLGRMDVEGQSATEIATNPLVPMEVGGAEYFRTLDIPLRRGRGFRDSDDERAPPVAVVSEAIAQRWWPNEDPIGKRIKFWGPDTLTWRTVIGVAGDIRYRELRTANPSVYLPWRQAYWQAAFALRTSGELRSVLPAVQREVAAVDPQLNLWLARSMNDLLDAPLAQPRMSATLLAAFALVALLLAAIGLYGVMAALVREQTRELGIRMALGATRERVRRSVLRRALIVTTVGAVAGLAGALVTSQLLRKLLFQVSPTDPATLLGASVLLLVVALAAAYLPAHRATRIDPVQALRAE